ncbi:MAG TPA: beta-galactosidase trimerization domain-containing protein [Pirellulaceae bacterium]|nr:beta-galactosidase trimerization domain-containing protein [Pirellulaceae bacterium]
MRILSKLGPCPWLLRPWMPCPWMLYAWLLTAAVSQAAETDTPSAAQALGRSRAAVSIQPDGLYICEAEEFQASPSSATGWQAKRFGENYYAATFANSFLSRQAFLGAPEQCDQTIATINVDIRESGRYLVLVRYEAAYRFETQFRVQVEQAGKTVLDRPYGSRDQLKIWAFSQKLKKEVGWSWGAVENTVWEGHDAFANLKPGRAQIRLIAGKQPEPAARRNIDLVMLTTDTEQIQMRIEKENYLPLDGMLTQSGDVYLRVTNRGSKPLTFSGKKAIGGGNWQQHSPYWVHLRTWKTPSIVDLLPGKTSDWVEVGGTMDALADGQWFWTGNGDYEAEFGLKNAAGKIDSLGKFAGNGDLALAADGDTRYSRRLRKQDQVLYDLLDYLKMENPARHGRTPEKTIIYASTFKPLDQSKHATAVGQFKQMFALSDTNSDSARGRGYVDVRGVATPKLAEYCEKLGDNAKNIAVVSLGDEIGLPSPRGTEANDGFRAWLQARGMKPADVRPNAGNDWTKVVFDIDPMSRETQPGVFYWSKRFQYHFGIQTIKQRTDILRNHLPNAGIGANFSPHNPQEHMFLGEVFKWISVFRDSGMTLPWSEDYIWQVPVATPQLNNINLDLFRAANRHHPDRKIIYYVMPHMPNNTPNQWRRLFFGALGHGMKIVDLFEFRPVHVAYTENHVDDPAMYKMVLGSFRELGLFEDIVQDGQVRAGQTALWFSETGDIWGDSHDSFAPAKRTLYAAIRHQQIPLDIVIEQDALDGTLAQYKTLYLTDAHVSRAASAKIASWVKAGGNLFATAGAGMFDELSGPNESLRKVLGVVPKSMDAPPESRVVFTKQDLPFARVFDRATLQASPTVSTSPEPSETVAIPVVGARSRFQTDDAEVRYTFSDGSPAVARNKVGRGVTTYCGFLPGLSYYHPAVPKRPVDRGATDDAMIHFLPTEFNTHAAELIASAATNVARPVVCSNPLVETTVIESTHGAVIPLVNWTQQPIKALQVTISIRTPTAKVSLASGRSVGVQQTDSGRVLTFDLDVADVLILR